MGYHVTESADGDIAEYHLESDNIQNLFQALTETAYTCTYARVPIPKWDFGTTSEEPLGISLIGTKGGTSRTMTNTTNTTTANAGNSYGSRTMGASIGLRHSDRPNSASIHSGLRPRFRLVARIEGLGAGTVCP